MIIIWQMQREVRIGQRCSIQRERMGISTAGTSSSSKTRPPFQSPSSTNPSNLFVQTPPKPASSLAAQFPDKQLSFRYRATFATRPASKSNKSVHFLIVKQNA